MSKYQRLTVMQVSGHSTYVFWDGKLVKGITDFQYSAKDSNGNNCPTATVTFEVDKLQLVEDKTPESVAAKIREAEEEERQAEQNAQPTANLTTS